MKVAELERCLQEEGFPYGSYALHGEIFDGCYTLTQAGFRWIVDYNERGRAGFVAEFALEEDACDFFLKKMRQEVPR